MANLNLAIHSANPETNKIKNVATALRDGAVVLYPTDTGFSLGCQLADKNAITRLRQIRKLPDDKSLSFLCDSLANISEFAKVSNHAYRAIRALIPGPYTFILPASKSVPKFAQDAKRRTAGIRVPNCTICSALLKELGSPLVSISAKPNGDLSTYEEIISSLSPVVDIVIESDIYNFLGESTVIDMTTDDISIIRQGAGYEKVLDFLPNEVYA